MYAEELRALDRLRTRVPNRDGHVEIGISRNVAASKRGVVAKDFLFEYRFARTHGLEEISQVIHHVAITAGRRVNLLPRFHFVAARTRSGVLSIPLGNIFFALLFRPGANGIVLARMKLRLRAESEGCAGTQGCGGALAANEHRAFFPVEGEKLILVFVVLVAA